MTAPESGQDLTCSGFDVHRLVVDRFGAQRVGREVSASARGLGDTGTYTSREIEAEFPFNEVVPSFNADLPTGTGLTIHLRFRLADSLRWTSSYPFGAFGAAEPPAKPHVTDDDGTVKVDCFTSTHTFDRLQYCVRFVANDAATRPRLVRFALCYSNTTGDQALWRRFAPKLPAGAAHQLAVPFRSQYAEDESQAPRLCSPTSVAMVLAFHGINVSTRRVAELAHDPVHDIYGNWMRAIQTAWALGVPGTVRRFHSLDEAANETARGQPLVLSIRAEPGELPGAPYHQTSGHLLVLVGFDARGNPLTNDPAGRTSEFAPVQYPRDALANVWLGRGGVAYVLGPHSAAEPL